jgi:nicotinate-nucleotide--dimethylbenzimidazole phosphoribosyltransferase
MDQASSHLVTLSPGHLVNSVKAIDPHWFHRAAEYQKQLTMPAGALGRLLDIGQQLCAIQETLRPETEPATVLVMAADHGVAAEGVSAYPQEVTGQMVANFLAGGAAINVLARRAGAQVVVVDMGLHTPPAEPAADARVTLIADRCIGRGTDNFLHGPAMSREAAERALAAGRQVVAEQLAPQGARVVALGEMGIGNTTSASALTAALTGRLASTVTGRGTGVDDVGWQRKVDVIARALRRHFPDGTGNVDPLAALTAVGGFEIAGLAGAALEAAARRMAVILDGFISSVAGLVAARLDANVRGYFLAGHHSVEAGHRAVLEALELQPLLDMNLRLGEGTGAVLALNLIHGAADIMRNMATFQSAGVQERG